MGMGPRLRLWKRRRNRDLWLPRCRQMVLTTAAGEFLPGALPSQQMKERCARAGHKCGLWNDWRAMGILRWTKWIYLFLHRCERAQLRMSWRGSEFRWSART